MRYADLKPVIYLVALSRAKDGWLVGWHMPCSCRGPGWRICQCYRPKTAGEVYTVIHLWLGWSFSIMSGYGL